MKNIIYILFGLLIFGCEKFLDEDSKDLVIPATVKDYGELLFGEAYFTGVPTGAKNVHTYLDLMTDDVEDNINNGFLGSDNRRKGWGYFTWQQEPEIDYTGTLGADEAYYEYYHSIIICNIVIDAGRNMEGNASERDFLLAEAHAQRAFDYYMLVNLYGEPYDKGQQGLGVPFNDLTSAKNISFSRASVGEIYERINSDIDKAVRLFAGSGNTGTVFRWNLPALYVFASRVSLYTKDWDRAIDMASKAIRMKPSLYSLSLMDSKNEYFFGMQNGEILFSYGGFNNYYYAYMAKSIYSASSELQKSYTSDDLRLQCFFRKRKGRLIPNKSYIPEQTRMYAGGIRTAEAYMNRAEAYAEKGRVKDAMEDVNTVLKHRLKVFKPLSAADREDCIGIVRRERRKEFCFEQGRWFDLRRWGRPRIEHKFKTERGKSGIIQRFVLEEEDPAYTLPLPKSVSETSSDIVNISRPLRNNLNEK